jgi:hypothetical protein
MKAYHQFERENLSILITTRHAVSINKISPIIQNPISDHSRSLYQRESFSTEVFKECIWLWGGGLNYYSIPGMWFWGSWLLYLVNIEVLLPEGSLHAVVCHAVGAVQVQQVLRALFNVLVLVFSIPGSLASIFCFISPYSLYRKSDLCMPRNETALSHSQFLHSCISYRFLCISRISLPIWLQQNRQTDPGNI